MKIDDDALDLFGKQMIEGAGDLSIEQEFRILEGTAKASVKKELSTKFANIDQDLMNGIKDLIIIAVDGALNNFLWTIEQSDEFDFIFQKDNKVISLKDVSDGLCGDYWNFVDAFSKYKNCYD